MKKNGLIKKIKSKYIIKNIFEYIKNDELKFKLFFYSKEFQDKVDINQILYFEKFLDKKKFCAFKYFSYMHEYYAEETNEMPNKKELKNYFKNDLIKYNISLDIFYLYLYYLFTKTRKYPNSFIDIFSPYFKILLYNFPYIFSFLFIPITIELIEKQDLKNDFLDAFNEMKKSEIEQISIFFFFNKTKDIDFLKTLATDFKIKSLIIKENEKLGIDKDNNFNIFFKELFTFNIINTLKKLTISLNGETISKNLLEKINDLKILEELKLINIDFEDVFVLKLKNLKLLTICQCQNIAFIEDIFLNLEELYILISYIKIPKSLMKIPNVKKCALISEYYIIEDFKSIIDYSSMKNIEELRIGMNEFLDLDCSLYKYLKKLVIYFNYYDINHKHFIKYKSHSLRIKMFKKILLIKTLKTLEIPYIDIDEKDKVEGYLDSVTQLNIILNSFLKNKDCFQVSKIKERFPKVECWDIRNNDL